MANYILVHGIRVAKDFTPETFGRLTTIGPAFRLDKSYYQVCECSCGTIKVCGYYDLRRGYIVSCGCRKQETTTKRNFRHGHGSKGIVSGTYNTWRGMCERCTNPNATMFKYYGGRGIKVCNRWIGENGFINFLHDMGIRPTDKSLDRIDNEGDYYPENCRWATKEEQSNNTSQNINITAFGKTQTLAQWAREVNLTTVCLRLRIFRRNWPIEKALTTPPRR